MLLLGHITASFDELGLGLFWITSRRWGNFNVVGWIKMITNEC